MLHQPRRLLLIACVAVIVILLIFASRGTSNTAVVPPAALPTNGLMDGVPATERAAQPLPAGNKTQVAKKNIVIDEVSDDAANAEEIDGVPAGTDVAGDDATPPPNGQ